MTLMKQINFKKFFDDDDLLTGKIMQLIELTQENINNNNNKQKEVNKNDIRKLRKKNKIS